MSLNTFEQERHLIYSSATHIQCKAALFHWQRINARGSSIWWCGPSAAAADPKAQPIFSFCIQKWEKMPYHPLSSIQSSVSTQTLLGWATRYTRYIWWPTLAFFIFTFLSIWEKHNIYDWQTNGETPLTLLLLFIESHTCSAEKHGKVRHLFLT